MIPSNIIEQIIETAQIDEVVGDYVTLKKRGANMLGNCPFHNEKTPSFTVSPNKGIFKCFGCGKGGNSVNFIMEHEHMSYPEALKFLANKYNIDVPEEERSPEQMEAENARESLYLVSAFAEEYFEDQLWTSDEGKAIGLSYFKERGFSEETIKAFKLGYSQEKWDGLLNAATNKGYKLDYLVDTGLVVKKEDKTYDRFRSRVIFPIHNLSGRVIAFGARTLLSDTKKTPKYLNSPETDIYHKSKILYGIYQAKKTIIQEDNCFLVEGYTDVISLYQSGIQNVVASSGTSLTTDQIRLIARYTPNITILYDGDAAGIKASFRGIDMILEQGMNVKVLLFPEGEDPDSYAKAHSTEELKDFIAENTQDFIQFKSKVLLEEIGNDPIKKAELIKDIVGSISKIPDGITRSVYIKECSNLLGVEEHILIDETNQLKLGRSVQQNRPSQQNRPGQQGPPSFNPNDFPPEPFPEELEAEEQKKGIPTELVENELIRYLISFGGHEVFLPENEDGEVPKILVAEWIVEEVLEDQLKFDVAVLQQIFDEYKSFLDQDKLPSDKHFYQHVDQEVCRKVVDITSSKYELSENWTKRHQIEILSEEDRLKKSIEKCLHTFKLKKVEALLNHQLEILKQNETKEDTDDILIEIVRYQQVIKALKQALGR